MARRSHPTMLLPDAPDEVMGDQYLYAAWRYEHLSAKVAASFKERGISVAAILAIFRDEWRRVKEAALNTP